MLSLRFNTDDRKPLKFLCLGAHSDDLEIGCGGTMLRLTETDANAEVLWIVFSADEQRAKEARNSANKFLGALREKKIVIKNFRDGFFPNQGTEIKEYFEQLKGEFSPDVIFTHYGKELHQDHRVISELTWNTFRDHLILEYEIPKYDGDLGAPNFYVHLEDALCRKKIQLLLENFPSQVTNEWFDEESFRALLRIRGLESNAPSRYAEAFYCRKGVF